ncbi:unnamed protein product [Dibothriocephalus latus]|uniref:Uncharacterized protein n=1 Tax=Dibothriocephalus latus TaxID=60516 RepID=A0A3P7P0R4_DIBLA|nr:unnamed protein product [Dibothriocephalus latus]
MDADGQLRETVEIDVENNPIFEDEDTRLFYESLPDIKAMVPGILYKESEQSVSRPATEPQPSEPAEKTLPTEGTRILIGLQETKLPLSLLSIFLDFRNT